MFFNFDNYYKLLENYKTELNSPLRSLNLMSVFHTTKKNKHFHRVIGAHYLMFYKIMEVDFEVLSNHLLMFGYEYLIIFRVLSNKNYGEEIRNSDFQEHIIKEYNEGKFTLVIKTINIDNFLEEQILKSYFYEEKNINDPSFGINDFLFCFEGISYPELLVHFARNQIQLTAGSISLRYVINPVKYKLAQVIVSIEGGNPIGVTTGFTVAGKQINNQILNSTKTPFNIEDFIRIIKEQSSKKRKPKVYNIK